MRAVEMTWRGKAFTIPANRAFEIGEQVEDIVTLAEVASWGSRPKMFKLAKCYGAMLRFAGAKVADVTILEEITPVEGRQQEAAAQAVNALVDLLLSGAKGGGDSEPPKKTSDL